VGNTAQLLTAVSALAPDSRVGLTLQRGNKTLELTLQVTQRPMARRQGGD
jgi:S1-C subfamily serine protease